MITAFYCALQFLTRIPVYLKKDISAECLGKSVLFYPLIGLGIGGFLLFIQLLLPPNTPFLNSIIVLSAWVLITGGLHLDGLADCADAWAGGLNNKVRTLAIMKDPASGPIAVVILILLLLLKASALFSLLNTEHNTIILLISPVLGRVSILMLMLSAPYLRENGLGAVLQQHLPKPWAVYQLIIILLLCLYFTHFYLVLSLFIGVFFIRHLAIRRLQGVTGDVYGASVEILETLSLVTWVLLNE